MRNLEDVEKDLKEAREALSTVEGNSAEVYSRIVGYYRSVRNWNKGKREEYGERKLYDTIKSMNAKSLVSLPPASEIKTEISAAYRAAENTEHEKSVDNEGATKVLLFVRHSCPQCPAAKNAVAQLGISVETVDAGSESGLAEAERWTVMSTPTAILLSKNGKELARAQDSLAIKKFLPFIDNNKFEGNKATLKSA